jgi:cell division protein FtsW (lipid II flippase)
LIWPVKAEIYYLELQHQCTIFAIFVEEFGLVGCIILIVCLFYIIRGYRIAIHKDRLGFLTLFLLQLAGTADFSPHSSHVALA